MIDMVPRFDLSEHNDALIRMLFSLKINEGGRLKVMDQIYWADSGPISEMVVHTRSSSDISEAFLTRKEFLIKDYTLNRL